MPSMPDFTPAQIKSTVAALAAVLTVMFKLNITDTWQAAIVGAIVGVYTLAHMISDAIVRHGRAKVAAAQITSLDTFRPALPDQGDAKSKIA